MRPILQSEIDRKRKSFKSARQQVQIEVWRDPDPAEENTDTAGFPLQSGEQGVRKVAEYPGRFYLASSGDAEKEFGSVIVTITQWIFVFNEGDNPNVRGSDLLKVDGRTFEVANAGVKASTAIQRRVLAVEIL